MFKKNNIINHFLLMKMVDKIPNNFLIHDSSSPKEAFELAEKIIKILNCPLNLNCEDFCQACRFYEKKDIDLIFMINAEEKTSKEEINELKIWSLIQTKKFKKKFVFISAVDALSKIIVNSLLKWFEEISENVVVILTTSKKNLIPRTLLSRFQIFSVGGHEWNEPKNFSILNEKEKMIFMTLSKENIWSNQPFIEKIFLPLKYQIDLFFHHLVKKKTSSFLIIYDEDLILQNFWLFLKIMLIYFHLILLKTPIFLDQRKLANLKIHQMLFLTKKIFNSLIEKNNFYYQTKNLLSNKLLFLEILSETDNLSINLQHPTTFTI